MLQKNGVGFWDVNTADETYWFSDDIAAQMGLGKQVVSYSELDSHIPEDFRIYMIERVRDKRNRWTTPLETNNGTQWFDFRRLLSYNDDNGTVHYCGSIKRMARSEIDKTSMEAGVRMETIIHLVNSLPLIMRSESFYDGVHLMLTSLHSQVVGMRTCVFRWRGGDEFQCIDVVGNELTNRNGELVHPGMSLYSPWLEHLCTNKVVMAMTDIQAINAEWPLEREFFRRNGNGSAIVAPIVERSGEVWGVIGVLRSTRTIWSSVDREWIQMLSNAMSMALEQNQVDEKLKEQRVIMAMAYEAAHVHSWSWNCRTGKRINNIFIDGKLKNFDVNDTSMEYQIHPSDRPRYEQAAANMLAKKTDSMSIKIRCRLTEETDFSWYEIRGYVVSKEYDGTPIHVVGLSRNIDGEMRRAIVMKREIDFQNTLYNKLPAGIEFYNAEGKLTYANDKLLEIFGVKNGRESIYGLSLFDNPNISDEQKQIIRDSDSSEFIIRYDFSKLGEYYESQNSNILEVVYAVSKLYINDVFTGYLGVVVDNTKLSNQNKKIEAFENYFLEIGRFAKLGLCWTSSKYGYVTEQWNRNFNRLPQASAHEKISTYASIVPDDREQLAAEVEELRHGKIDSIQRDVRLAVGEGDTRWVRVHIMCNAKGDGFTALSIDITQQKENEQMLIQARERAERMDLLKSQFLANMSHEIRTPLNAIVGFSDLVLQCDDPADREVYAGIIHSNNELLLKLIGDILDLSKIESGNMEFSYSMVNIPNMCNEIYRSLAIKAPQGVQFIYNPNREYRDLEAYCDKMRLTQVITNFVNNAFKFTTAGHVLMWFEIEDDMLKFHVSDTGKGISPNDLDRIFETFVKLDMFAVGTGLGLPICRSIAKQMGGSVEVESTLGKGSHFWIQVPYLFEEDASYGTHGSEGHANVMVLENDPDTMMLLTCCLEGYNVVRGANTGFTSLWLNKRPAMTIIDAGACADGALDLIFGLRSYGEEYIIVAINNADTGISDADLIDAGANDVLQYPINSDLCMNVLRSHLR